LIAFSFDAAAAIGVKQQGWVRKERSERTTCQSLRGDTLKKSTGAHPKREIIGISGLGLHGLAIGGFEN